MQKVAAFFVRNTPPGLKRVVGKPLRQMAGAFAAKDDLQMLGVKHPTDKLTHGYLPFYQRHFEALRLQAGVVLEIGIGGYGDPASGGGSLRLWRNYFPNAHIHGLDLHDKTPLNGPRLTTHQGSQGDPATLDALIDKIGQPDIIIDDGSHRSEHVIATFERLFPKLSPGGVYVIEDLETSYLAEYGGGADDLASKKISTGYLKDYVDAVNSKYIPGRTAFSFDEHIAGVSFYPNICFIEKRR